MTVELKIDLFPLEIQALLLVPRHAKNRFVTMTAITFYCCVVFNNKINDMKHLEPANLLYQIIDWALINVLLL